MSSKRSGQSSDQRPDCMVELGLAPPYSQEDVQQAYLTKAKLAHPDRGGTSARFHALQEAYEQAKQFVDFRSDRRGWIAAKMKGYLSIQRVVQELEQHGAEVQTNAVDWLEKSFGDFAQLTERITRIRLADSSEAEEMIRTMIREKTSLAGLTQLELPGCQVSDQFVLSLSIFQELQYLDLTGTPITSDSLAIAEALPNLESLLVEGTRVGWWARRRVRSLMQKRRDSAPATTFR